MNLNHCDETTCRASMVPGGTHLKSAVHRKCSIRISFDSDRLEGADAAHSVCEDAR